jgi:arginase
VGNNRFLADPPTLSIIGSPVSAGQAKSGTELGPAALRGTNLVGEIMNTGWKVVDQGDIEYPTFEEDPPSKWGMQRSRLCAAANKALAEKMYPALKKGHFCLNLGGDHSTAVGSLAAVLKVITVTLI